MKWSRHWWVWTETPTVVLLLLTDSTVQKNQDSYDSQSPRGKEQLPNNFKQILGLRKGWGCIKKYKNQQWKFCSTANHPASFSSVAQSCPTLCDPMNLSTPGLPVHHQLPEFTQTHVHRVGDAIQPSHPLSSPSPPAPNPSQHQSLFHWVKSSHEVAKVLEFQL